MKKSLIKIAIVLGVVLIGVFSFLYWGVYDYGSRSGIVIRVSKKGALFKTMEGQLNLQTFGALERPNVMTESFDFSIDKKDEVVFQQLKDVSLSGERVRLEFKKRYIQVPWRGDSKYFVTEVVRSEQPNAKKERTNPYRENRETPTTQL